MNNLLYMLTGLALLNLGCSEQGQTASQPSDTRPVDVDEAPKTKEPERGASSIADLAKLYFDAWYQNDEAALRALWVTRDELATFVKKSSRLPEERHDEYVTEAMKQGADRLARQLEEMKEMASEPGPQYELIEAKPDGLDSSGAGYNSIRLKLRDPATQKVFDNKVINQEGIKIEGRWYFYERP